MIGNEVVQHGPPDEQDSPERHHIPHRFASHGDDHDRPEGRDAQHQQRDSVSEVDDMLPRRARREFVSCGEKTQPSNRQREQERCDGVVGVRMNGGRHHHEQYPHSNEGKTGAAQESTGNGDRSCHGAPPARGDTRPIVSSQGVRARLRCHSGSKRRLIQCPEMIDS